MTPPLTPAARLVLHSDAISPEEKCELFRQMLVALGAEQERAQARGDLADARRCLDLRIALCRADEEFRG